MTHIFTRKKEKRFKEKEIVYISYSCLANMVMERIIQSILPLPKFLIIVVLVASIFSSVDMQQASADDDKGNDNHHNLCNDHHFSKCLHNDGIPLILPFP